MLLARGAHQADYQHDFEAPVVGYLVTVFSAIVMPRLQRGNVRSVMCSA